jgi:hypothetical protein
MCTCEVQPAVLVREGDMLLIKYSLDTRVRYSTYQVTDFHRGPQFSHNYLITTEK